MQYEPEELREREKEGGCGSVNPGSSSFTSPSQQFTNILYYYVTNERSSRICVDYCTFSMFILFYLFHLFFSVSTFGNYRA